MSDVDWLEATLRGAQAVAGTVHRRAHEQLALTAAIGIPEPVLEVTRLIPKGKGMAGLAWRRGRPVQTCDLKADVTGDVRPGAKVVDAGAAVAIPVFAADGTLRAVVGIAFASTDRMSRERIEPLTVLANTLPESI